MVFGSKLQRALGQTVHISIVDVSQVILQLLSLVMFLFWFWDQILVSRFGYFTRCWILIMPVLKSKMNYWYTVLKGGPNYPASGLERETAYNKIKSLEKNGW